MSRAPLAPQVIGTILNVNDRDQSRYVVSKVLRNAGYRVLEAASGLEAVDIAREHSPDLVVLDIRLPDIDGMEVARRLKADAATASSLILHTSATFASIDVKIRGLDVGGDAFLGQPFTNQELIATVKALLRLKRVEDFQRRRAEEFAEADRRKDDFLAMLGHELRNPLNAITMAQAIIDRHPAQNPDEERARAVARRQTAQLTRLVNDLLEVSRVTRGKIAFDRRTVDLTALLQQVAATFEETTLRPRGQTLSISLPSYPVNVDADRVRLEQVFTNLLDNASKYSPDGTSVDVELAVEAHADHPEAVVIVADHGHGIAREQLSQVFNLFYQGQPTEARIGSGLGIGLTLVRSLVESHGGSVAVRSEGVGKGSEFEVRLPTTADAVSAAATDVRYTAAKRRRLLRGARTVLLVEDNRDARDMLATLCRAWGYQVELADDGLQGVAKALAIAPQLALIDIGLPGIDGYEVARRLRRSPLSEEITLVALTGYGLPEQRQKALEAGFDAHLVKPVDAELLEALLEEPRPTISTLAERE